MLICGDALTELQKLEPESVDCCITSPPYWALRDYKVDGQLGLEPTIGEYVTKLVGIFDEVKRVLKKTGSCWVVIGDTYSQNSIRNRDPKTNGDAHFIINNRQNQTPEKSLCMIPERFAISMINNGWILRNKIIWYKPNCMPSSAKDRFTVDWEYVYFFTKSQKYFFETQYEPTILDNSRYDIYPSQRNKKFYKDKENPDRNDGKSTFMNFTRMRALGRIKRCVFKSDVPYMRLRKDLSEEKKKEVIDKLLELGLI